MPRNRNRRAPAPIIVHSTPEPIPPEDITTIDGIPVTTPARTFLDLLTVEAEDVVGSALDDALRHRLVTLSFLDSWLEDGRRRSHRGWRAMRRLVDVRLGRGVTESPLEDQFLALLARAGLPTPLLQFEVRDGDRFIARLDFAYPDQRVAVEVDGFRFHAGRSAFDDDRARANAVQALGWRVFRVTSKHLIETPDAVVAWVRKALSRYP